MQFLARVRRPVSREIAYKPTELSTIKLRHFYLIEEGKLNGEILLCFDLNWSGSSVYCRCVKREERKKRERRKRKRINGLSLSNFSWFISPKMLVFHGDCCKNPGFASMVYKFALEIPYALNDRCVCLLIMVWNLWHCFYLLIITFVCWFCLFTITFTLRFVFHCFSSIVPCILRYWNFAVFVFLKCIVCTSVFLHFKRFFFFIELTISCSRAHQYKHIKFTNTFPTFWTASKVDGLALAWHRWDSGLEKRTKVSCFFCLSLIYGLISPVLLHYMQESLLCISWRVFCLSFRRRLIYRLLTFYPRCEASRSLMCSLTFTWSHMKRNLICGIGI